MALLEVKRVFFLVLGFFFPLYVCGLQPVGLALGMTGPSSWGVMGGQGGDGHSHALRGKTLRDRNGVDLLSAMYIPFFCAPAGKNLTDVSWGAEEIKRDPFQSPVPGLTTWVCLHCAVFQCRRGLGPAPSLRPSSPCERSSQHSVPPPQYLSLSDSVFFPNRGQGAWFSF